MNTKKIFSMFLIAFMFLGITVANAQPMSKCRGGGGDGMLNIPDLTDQQKEKIEEMRTPHMKTMLQLRNQMNEKRAHLKTLSSADKADMNAINKTIDEMGEITTKIMKERAGFHQEIRNILTEEQRVFFDSRKMYRRGKRGDCPGEFHRPRNGGRKGRM